MSHHYDVIIVGGRAAGATLAARLGRAGLRVLLLERAAFPSLPPASSPIIYSPSMQLLDEVGADEAAYARNTPPIRRVIGQNSAFEAVITLPPAQGRDYAYAIDRARFDAALWDNALRFPSVQGRQDFGVTDLLWDGGRVVGVVGKAANPTPRPGQVSKPAPTEWRGGEEARFTAEVVVGADGRFSPVARKANAAVRDEYTAHPTSLYYAYWKNVRPYDQDGATAVAYEGGRGYGFLVMDSADDTTLIGFEGQAALLDPAPGRVEAFYLELVRANAKIRARLQAAEMVTPVGGMRRIGNLYRQPGGPGWALVGDAYHQHDPLDGQGIYNALFTAKALAWALLAWTRGEKSWAQALAAYDETARIKTYGRYKAALDNVRQNLYGDVPGWALIGLRWVMQDPTMQALMGKLLTRQIPAEVLQLALPPVMVGAVLRGPWRDLRKRLDVG